MTREPIQLVIFDLGRVMVRLCKGWQHAFERAGVPFHADYHSPAWREAVHQLTYRSETGRLDHEGWNRAMVELTGLNSVQIEAISFAWLDGPYPGWDALLDRLAAAQLLTACLSNTNAAHWELLGRPGGPNHLPMERLTYRFASHLIGAHKPEPEIYEHVERQTGIQPQSIIFFDDLAANVEAARARGWSAVVIDPAGDPVKQVEAALGGCGAL